MYSFLGCFKMEVLAKQCVNSRFKGSKLMKGVEF